MVRTVSPDLLRKRLVEDDPPTVIDTRPSDDYEAWHIPGVYNYPFKPDDTVDLDNLASATNGNLNGEVITLCAKGKASTAFAQRLGDLGIEEVSVVQDGMEGWSRVYELAAVPTVASGLEMYQVQRLAKGCLSYLLATPSSGEAVVVDPSRHREEYQRIAEDDGMTITHVIDTHVHADHISGGRALADATEASYHLPVGAADRGVEYAYEPLEHNGVLTVGSFDIKAVPTPGHTSESMSLLIGGEAILTGDTLFVDSVGRTELQFGDADAAKGARELYTSIHRTILSLPENVKILPGHAPSEKERFLQSAGSPEMTTVSEQRTQRELLRQDQDAFITAITESLPDKPANFERMLEINTGRDTPEDDAEAIELELGPNRCAAH